MDIEGFVRRRIAEEDQNTIEDILADRIMEFKDIGKENALKMASAVVDEVQNTLKIKDQEDEFLKEIIGFP